MSFPDHQSTGQEHPVDLVFEGGGVKGIGLAGAYRALWDHGYRPRCVAGTSAGAITAALVAVGYTGGELEDIVLGDMVKDLPQFEDRTLLDRFGLPGQLLQFLVTRGVHSGDYFMSWMRDLLRAKGITTFGQLRDDQATRGNRTYPLQVVASDLSARSMLVLPRDTARLGKKPDELEIAEAVRMSMSIPVFFKPVTRPGVGGKHVIVDGGLLSNYPIGLFDAPEGTPPSFPTFGLLLVAPGQKAPLLPDPPTGDQVAPAESNIDFLRSIAETMMEAHDRLYVEQENFVRTIPIPTLGVKTTQFDISKQQAKDLFDSGKKAADQFLDAWCFQAYKEKFRSGKPLPNRRAEAIRA